LDTAAFGRDSLIGHYLFDAPGCEAKKFELPEVKEFSYPRDLPIHNGEPSRTVLEIRGNDNTYTMFPPSIHPCGEKLAWVGAKRKPAQITAKDLRELAGRHAVAAAVLYFYPGDAPARYDCRMALTGALARSGMPAEQVGLYVRQVAKLAGDPKWKEKSFAERTEKRLQEGKKVTALTKLIEILQLPDTCLGVFYEWLNVVDDDDDAVDENIEPVDLWANFLPPELSRGVLPKPIEDYAFTMGEAIGCDPAAIAMAALTVCGAAITDEIKLQLRVHNTWSESARLWVAIIGPPSFKKTPAITAAMRPLRKLDRDLVNGYLYDLKVYKELSNEDRKGKEAPKEERLILEDTTYEATQEVLANSLRGVLLYQDELAAFFGGMDKYSGQRGSARDRGFYLDSWYGHSKTVNRVGRGLIHIPNLSISLAGGIQPDLIRKVAADSLDDGFLARMLMLMARPATVSKDLPTATIVNDNYEELIERLTKLEPPLDSLSQLPAPLRFDDGAQKLFAVVERKHLEWGQTFETFNKKLAAAIGKYDSYFGRMCLLWHCIEHAGEKQMPLIITEHTARRVTDFLHGFLLQHAKAFYCGVLGLADDHDRLAAIASYILTHKVQELTPRDIQRGTWAMRGLKRRDVEETFEQLEALGWVGRKSGPRQVPHWIVNLRVHELFAERTRMEAAKREVIRRVMNEDFAARRRASHA
jgi:hypothetical protein